MPENKQVWLIHLHIVVSLDFHSHLASHLRYIIKLLIITQFSLRYIERYGFFKLRLPVSLITQIKN